MVLWLPWKTNWFSLFNIPHKTTEIIATGIWISPWNYFKSSRDPLFLSQPLYVCSYNYRPSTGPTLPWLYVSMIGFASGLICYFHFYTCLSNLILQTCSLQFFHRHLIFLRVLWCIIDVVWIVYTCRAIQGGPKNSKLSHFVHIFAKYWPIFTFFHQSTGEKIVKIGKYLAKIWPKYDSLVFWATLYIRLNNFFVYGPKYT